MKKVYLLAFIAAVLFGGLMYLYLTGSSGQASAATETKTVVVATVDIAPDATITADMVKEEQVPASSVQVNSLSSVNDVIGKCCPAQIVKGEQLLSNMLTDPGTAGIRLSAQLSNGMYGMTIKVETDAGVGGYIKAGDYIDLIGTQIDEDGNVALPVAVGKIVENVEVVRVSEASSEGGNSYSYLTLTMNESQCETVYAYQVALQSGSVGDYHALLRSSGGAQ